MARPGKKHPFLFVLPDFESTAWKPLADIYQYRGGWCIKLDLAGVAPGDVTLHVEGSTLHIHGQRRDLLVREGYRPHSMEICYSQFHRSIQLPESLEAAEVQSMFENGMLVVLVRTEKEKPDDGRKS